MDHHPLFRSKLYCTAQEYSATVNISTAYYSLGLYILFPTRYKLVRVIGQNKTNRENAHYLPKSIGVAKVKKIEVHSRCGHMKCMPIRSPVLRRRTPSFLSCRSRQQLLSVSLTRSLENAKLYSTDDNCPLSPQRHRGMIFTER